jgi:hypothetical protein
VDRVFALLPAELVDDVLKVVFRSIGIVGLDGRLVVLVDQVLVIFGRAWLDLRFRTTTFNTIIEACEIQLGGWGQPRIDCGIVPADHREGRRIVQSCGGGAESRISSCEVLSREGEGGW